MLDPYGCIGFPVFFCFLVDFLKFSIVFISKANFSQVYFFLCFLGFFVGLLLGFYCFLKALCEKVCISLCFSMFSIQKLAFPYVFQCSRSKSWYFLMIFNALDPKACISLCFFVVFHPEACISLLFLIFLCNQSAVPLNRFSLADFSFQFRQCVSRLVLGFHRRLHGHPSCIYIYILCGPWPVGSGPWAGSAGLR